MDAYWSLQAICHTDISFSTEDAQEMRNRYKRDTEVDTAITPHPEAKPSKRAMFTAAMILVTLISMFTAGSAVEFAVQGQVAKQQAAELQERVDYTTAAIDSDSTGQL